jgi:glyoxylase-like metal-dependent hydrolase (beta-lactamase superfamily II)
MPWEITMPLSRRDFVRTSVATAAAGTVLRPSSLLAREIQEARASFTPVRRNVGYFTMRGGTIGWLLNDEAVAVVDSQFPEQAAALLEGLNRRSGDRGVDCLVNTHHHGDHTGGNVAFRGSVGTVVAHEMAAEHMRNPPNGQPPEDQLYPDTTFSDSWSMDLGDETVWARHYGRAHTSGDAVITFEQANVAHMGDLMFHRRQPVVDRAAGATLRGWMSVLDRTLADHSRDTIYIFGHAGPGLPVTGTHTDLVRFHDYVEAVLGWVGAQVRAGSSREEILAQGEPLGGFEDFGPFRDPGAREIRTCAYEEITTGE